MTEKEDWGLAGAPRFWLGVNLVCWFYSLLLLVLVIGPPHHWHSVPTIIGLGRETGHIARQSYLVYNLATCLIWLQHASSVATCHISCNACNIGCNMQHE